MRKLDPAQRRAHEAAQQRRRRAWVEHEQWLHPQRRAPLPSPVLSSPGWPGDDGSSARGVPTAEQVATFITTARGDLERLAADLAAAQAHDADGDEVQILYRRFTELQATTTRHAELLQCALDDVQGALELVRMQITGLLAGTGLTP